MGFFLNCEKSTTLPKRMKEPLLYKSKLELYAPKKSKFLTHLVDHYNFLKHAKMGKDDWLAGFKMTRAW